MVVSFVLVKILKNHKRCFVHKLGVAFDRDSKLVIIIFTFRKYWYYLYILNLLNKQNSKL